MSDTGKKALGRPPTMPAPRETILASAARLFGDKGFEQTSLMDVARAVGVSKAAVYHYFQSKQVLYDEIVIGLLEGLVDHVGQQVRAEPEPSRRLRTFMLAHADYFDKNYIAFVTLLHGRSGLGSQIESGRQIAVRDQHEALLRSLLTEGVEAGRLAVDDVAITARGILSMLNWMTRWYRPGAGKSAVAIAEHYYAMVSGGIEAAGRPRAQT